MTQLEMEFIRKKLARHEDVISAAHRREMDLHADALRQYNRMWPSDFKAKVDPVLRYHLGYDR